MAEQGRRRALVGVVVSTKMDKTAVVAVERRVSHRLYGKIIKRTNRYKAHDAQNESRLGDIVRIVETRPLSKEKHWRIGEFLVRGDVAELAPRDIGAPAEAMIVRAEVPAPPAAAPPEPSAAAAETDAAEEETES